jgi:1,4-dihydroxy-2-naphthoate polyprenyltransferase
MGSFLAASEGNFRWPVLLLSLLTTIFLQVLSNLANDYGDSRHGADHSERKGPKRAVQAGLISPDRMKRAILLFVALSLCSGVLLIGLSLGWTGLGALLFFGLGLLAIAAALKYTVGSNPYGYAGLGDLFVLIFFGMVGVLGTYYLHALHLRWEHFLPALSSGLLATGVLNINNIRDIDSDRRAGKRSVPVRIGLKWAVIYHWMLLGGAVLAAMVYAGRHFRSPWQWLFLLTLPLLWRNGLAVQHHGPLDSASLDPYLRQLAISTLLFMLAFGTGMLI